MLLSAAANASPTGGVSDREQSVINRSVGLREPAAVKALQEKKCSVSTKKSPAASDNNESNQSREGKSSTSLLKSVDKLIDTQARFMQQTLELKWETLNQAKEVEERRIQE